VIVKNVGTVAETELTILGLFFMNAPPEVAFQSIYSALKLAAGTVILLDPSKGTSFIVLAVANFVAFAAFVASVISPLGYYQASFLEVVVGASVVAGLSFAQFATCTSPHPLELFITFAST
jgi:hypothetical protein